MRRKSIGLVLGALLFPAISVSAQDARTEGWPEFRGPMSSGHAPGERKVATKWSENRNVTWKTAIPHAGWSTPVVWGDQVWLTTATEEGTESDVLALDRNTGEVLHNARLFHTDSPEPLGNNVNGYASPSPAIEAGRVYLSFGSYGTACLDTKSFEIVWTREDFECRHYRGPGSSLYLHDDTLYISFDGVDLQYLVALDKHTGETRWRTDRSTVWDDWTEEGIPFRDGDMRKGFSTPVITQVNGRPLLLSIASKTLFGYDPATGDELWKMSNPGHTPSTRPVLKDDVAFVMTGYSGTELRAVRLDGVGDVTETHLKWSQTGSHLPDTPSPILVGELLYTVSNRGIISALDPESGEPVWNERIGGNFIASPVYAGGHLYFASTQGKTTVLKPGRSFEAVAENELDEGLMASPAIAGDALFLRTKTHLYRIDKP